MAKGKNKKNAQLTPADITDKLPLKIFKNTAHQPSTQTHAPAVGSPSSTSPLSTPPAISPPPSPHPPATNTETFTTDSQTLALESTVLRAWAHSTPLSRHEAATTAQTLLSRPYTPHSIRARALLLFAKLYDESDGQRAAWFAQEAWTEASLAAAEVWERGEREGWSIEGVEKATRVLEEKGEVQEGAGVVLEGWFERGRVVGFGDGEESEDEGGDSDDEDDGEDEGDEDHGNGDNGDDADRGEGPGADVIGDEQEHDSDDGAVFESSDESDEDRFDWHKYVTGVTEPGNVAGASYRDEDFDRQSTGGSSGSSVASAVTDTDTDPSSVGNDGLTKSREISPSG